MTARSFSSRFGLKCLLGDRQLKLFHCQLKPKDAELRPRLAQTMRSVFHIVAELLRKVQEL